MSEPQGQRYDEPGNIPIPDPSVLTTRQLEARILALRELVEEMLSSEKSSNRLIRGIIETRLDGMDKAIKLLQDTADKFPARIDEKITALSMVQEQKLLIHDERFSSVQVQFRERDVRTEQAAGAVKIAVDAALQAQKEAVGEQNKSSALAIAKSETSTTKQIDQLGTLIQSMTKGFDDKITDVKDRVTRVEGSGEGGKTMWAYIVGAIALAASLYFGLNHLQSQATQPVIVLPAPVVSTPTQTTTTTQPASPIR